ncbi:hypothetical+protein [Methylocapsa aurea]|uniref:hypothetical protein n=1 Tax=Methylocapsa aurea TaxID=663610 RepID=UPI003D18B8A5
MRKFWLRAALAASLLRGLCFGCALAVSWPFRFAARKLDGVVVACHAHAPAISRADRPPAPGAIWTVDGVQQLSPQEYRECRDAMASRYREAAIGPAPRDDVAAQYIDARSL